MSTSGVSVRDLLCIEQTDIAPIVDDHLKTSGAGTSIAGSMLGFALSHAADTLNNALNADVFELIGSAWTKASALKKYADLTKYPPGETFFEHLADHRITDTEEPVLEISIGGVPLPTLRFTLELTARFQSVDLAIEGGFIRSVSPGQMSALVGLKYKSVKLIKEVETPTLKLPGRIDFPKGFQIAQLTHSSPSV